MQQRTISHYCQKCLAANPLGQEFCGRCGTRLMIVVEPAATRVDMSETGAWHDQHVLERLSILENTLGRLAERLEQALKLLLRQSETVCVNHALVKSLIDVLAEAGMIRTEKLERLWREQCDKLEANRTEDSSQQAAEVSRPK